VILRVPEGRIDLTGREKVRYLSAYARKALAVSARRTGVALGALRKNEDGAPIPEEGTWWSVSHKSDCVAAVVAPGPVGIDIETVRAVSEALMRRIAGAEEWALLRGDRQAGFFRFWTAKEAVLKATGVGYRGLSKCRVRQVSGERHLVATYLETEWEVEQLVFDRWTVSVARQGMPVSWLLPEKFPNED
jgi:4'-phosphopantetheinyl transferase